MRTLTLLPFVTVVHGSFYGHFLQGLKGTNDVCGHIVAGPAVSPARSIRRSDCVSFLLTTVTPPAVTVTTATTITEGPSAKKRDISTTQSISAGVTDSTSKTIPTYATAACTATASYVSACYNFGNQLGSLTFTAPTPTSTQFSVSTVEASTTSTPSVVSTSGASFISLTGIPSGITTSESSRAASSTESSSASTTPTGVCIQDDCLHEFQQKDVSAPLFCDIFLSATITSTDIIPTYAAVCGEGSNQIFHVSSACSCILSPTSSSTVAIASSSEASPTSFPSSISISVPPITLPTPYLNTSEIAIPTSISLNTTETAAASSSSSKTGVSNPTSVSSNPWAAARTSAPFTNTTAATSSSSFPTAVSSSANITSVASSSSSVPAALSTLKASSSAPLLNSTAKASSSSILTANPTSNITSAAVPSPTIAVAASSSVLAAYNSSSETPTSNPSINSTTAAATTYQTAASSSGAPSPSPVVVSPIVGTCSNPLACDIGSACNSGSTCLCQPTLSGVGYCLGSVRCSDLQSCDSDQDCESGSTCLQTCCLENKCLSLALLCPNPSAPSRLFKKRQYGFGGLPSPVIKVGGLWSGVHPETEPGETPV